MGVIQISSWIPNNIFHLWKIKSFDFLFQSDLSVTKPKEWGDDPSDLAIKLSG